MGQLRRRVSLLQAVSLNMSMMVGIGSFTTLPALLGAMGGPQALVAWGLGVVVAVADGLVWSELAAAFPGSGGTYHFFDAVYGDSRAGRLLKFLFVWQFLFSGPLEVASGGIGVGRYAGYIWPALKRTAWSVGGGAAGSPEWTVTYGQWLAAAVMAACVVLAYRRIEAAGRLMVALWVGMLVTVVGLSALGLAHFDPRVAFDVPAGAWAVDRKFAAGLGMALGFVMYNFLGYYQVCYMGDEVADPARTFPRAILLSVVAVALLNVALNLAILGVIPWREAIRNPDHLASDLMERVGWRSAAVAATVMVVWTGAASIFAGLLGYSRVPYAAAKAGHFFRGLAKTHPTGDFPHRSLVLIGALSALACLVDFETLIAALLASRILVQFVGQIVTVFAVRMRPELAGRLTFRMALFPLPALVALAGWLWVFGVAGGRVIAFGVGSLLLGVVAFVVWENATAGRGQ